MRILYSVIVGSVLLVSGATLAGEKTKAADLAWLAGCWSGGGEGREYVEQWMKPAGGTLLGMSRTVKAGQTVAYEFVQIRERDGDLYYIAKPSGQAEAAFKLISADPKELIFENPDHDFPQRVIYRLEADGRLMAMVEGTIDGKLRQEHFPMTRTSCE